MIEKQYRITNACRLATTVFNRLYDRSSVASKICRGDSSLGECFRVIRVGVRIYLTASALLAFINILIPELFVETLYALIFFRNYGTKKQSPHIPVTLRGSAPDLLAPPANILVQLD
jgi:hypothetical protein